MLIYGYIIYLLLLAILWVFFTRVRGKTLEQLFDQSAVEHHQIIELHRKHPAGGDWQEFNNWLAVEKSDS